MSTHGRRFRTAGLLSIALAVAFATGCSDDPITGGDPLSGDLVPEMSIDLDLEDGGLAPDAEKPYFGDDYFSNFLSDDGDVEITDDPLTGDARLMQMERHPDAEVLFVRVLWGNMRRGLEADESDPEVRRIDWTGSARITDGLLMPLRTLRFERTDYLIPPWRQDDPSRQKVEWVSFTGPGRDGLLLKIVVPSADDSTMHQHRAFTNGDGLTPDDSFLFDTDPLRISFPLEIIADLDTTIMVDDTNGVVFTGFDRNDLDEMCPRGHMAGAWVRAANDERNGGFFRARWVGALGFLKGHVRGRWGVNNEGERGVRGQDHRPARRLSGSPAGPLGTERGGDRNRDLRG